MDYLLKSSIVIILFYSCYKLFLQKETFFEANRWFLLTGIAATLSLPLIRIPIYITREAPVFAGNFVETTSIAIPPVESLDYSTILFYLYCMGCILFSLRLLFQIGSLLRLFAKHRSYKKAGYHFIETQHNIAPFSFFKWIVYNPDHFNSEELHQILTHEKVHARQWHSIDLMVTQLASIIFWFHPFIWLYKKELQQNLEFIADSETQKDLHCKKSYQYLLLKTVTQNHQMALANNFYNSLIKKRIVMLHKHKSNTKKAWKYSLVLPLIALFLMSFSTQEIVRYTSTTPTLTENIIADNTEMILITKNTSDAELKSITESCKKKGITLKFKGVKRNKANEITKIDISAKTQNSKVSYNSNGDEGIETIKIKIENGQISIGDSRKHEIHFTDKGTVGYIYEEKHGEHKVKTKGNDVFVYSKSSTHHDSHEVIEDDDKIIIKKGAKVHEIKTSDDDDDSNVFIMSSGDGKVVEIKNGKHKIIEKSNNNMIHLGTDNDMVFISKDGDSKPIYIVDGKEIDSDDMSTVDLKNIESVSILKGDAAIKAYGKKAKDGAIIITTKN